ncbi:multidrug efflux pump [Terrimicrobium sacchariphilum]|uniref:Multidrug efflux pump n=1 Tax=Terrimicrobium sacchariphilum TaxID=690879 RepID=A0A146GDB6_TERSA|nr:efflux RND transporter permease subunit [Terrimicrobium sacchariphilum]GAT35341.1 multidrug efflux pump [Terrimicrobium sacchariphilum]
MNLARYFIDRPVFAWVIALVIMLTGGLALTKLPIAQYPNIAPPAIAISVNYPGASAATVQSSVVQVIEQQMNGIDNLIYFSSESTKDGQMTITLTFRQGTNPDVAQVQVQNKLALATPLLPQEVQQQGIRVAKSTRNFLLVVGFVSEDGKMTDKDVADFIVSTVQDPVSRTEGVGDFQVFGSQYAMRIWLDPAKLNNYQLTPGDVRAAIAAQNVQVAAGELGGLPSVKGQQLNATVVGPTRMTTPEEFGNILLKVNPDGGQVRLRDVAEVTLGAENYSITAKYNGKPASGLAIRLATGANALTTVENVKHTIEKLRPNFPEGLEVIYPLDTAPFIELSIEEVVKTLFEAIFLVFCVMYLFLQNFRATLIPTIAVPVVLLGTFGMLAAFGFSINTLTMFGMVLAIGLLVDDAIVVVENVERVMSEEGISPLEATRKSMDQITGALIAIGLVLSAVFIPMAFFGGSTGVIYRQFSITIVSAMMLSVLVAIVLTPSLCATLLKPVQKGHSLHRKGFFGWFNRTFDRGTHRYGATVQHILKRSGRYLVIYAAVVGAMVIIMQSLPKSFLPDEDQGRMFALVTLPPGSTIENTESVLAKVRNYLLNEEGKNVEGVFTVAGFSFAGRGQNSGLAFIRMKDWAVRPGKENKVQAIAQRAMGRFMAIREAMVFPIAPPAVMELGNASGFDFQLMDVGNVGHETLMNARNQLLGMAAKDPSLAGVRPNGLNDEPQFEVEIDREKASALGLTIADINSTLSAAWGSSYVNDFVDRGRVKRVFIQGKPESRMKPDDLGTWYVRNASGQMVPFSAFATGHWTYGSPRLERYNGRPSMQIQGNASPGLSTGDAMTAMENIAAKMPPGVGFEWTGLSYEERAAGAQAGSLYIISLVVVFLCLAALYENWAIPIAVLLAVPLGVFGAVLATWGRGLSNDVFLQVGILTIVGLSAKNAILIVEFAKANFEEGMDLVTAALEAARQRLRPILMTSLAFGLGVVPLAISTGAGSGGQNAIGTGVIGGTLASTFLGILLVPLFFVVIQRLFRAKPKNVSLTTKPTEPHTA